MDDQAAERRAALAARTRRGEDRAAQREPDVGARRDDRGIVAAELEHPAPEAPLDAHPDVLPHAHAARRADDLDPRMVGDDPAAFGGADRDLHQMLGREFIIGGDRLEQLAEGERGQRRLFRRLPDRAVAADERDGGAPCPDRGGEVERRDQPERPQRVPIFGQPVLGALRRDRQPEQLARQADGIFADVDDLLHFAARLGQDLAILDRQQARQRFLVLAHELAIAADQLAAVRCGHLLPREERGPGLRGHRVHVGGAVHFQRREFRPVDRREDAEVGPEVVRERQPEFAEQSGHFMGKAAGRRRRGEDVSSAFIVMSVKSVARKDGGRERVSAGRW